MLLHNMHSFRVDIGEIEIDADVGLRHLFDLQPRRVSYVHSFPSKLCLVQLQVFPGLSILADRQHQTLNQNCIGYTTILW